MYLENIFVGSEDIRKQLPQESAMFDGVHATFVRLMKQLNGAGTCLKATTAPKALATFQVRPRQSWKQQAVGVHPCQRRELMAKGTPCVGLQTPPTICSLHAAPAATHPQDLQLR